jgi:hypothetical protein
MSWRDLCGHGQPFLLCLSYQAHTVGCRQVLEVHKRNPALALRLGPRMSGTPRIGYALGLSAHVADNLQVASHGTRFCDGRDTPQAQPRTPFALVHDPIHREAGVLEM